MFLENKESLIVGVGDCKVSQDLNKTNNGHTGKVSALSISPDGSYFISCSFDKTIKVWKRGPRDIFYCFHWIVVNFKCSANL